MVHEFMDGAEKSIKVDRNISTISQMELARIQCEIKLMMFCQVRTKLIALG